MVRDVFAASSFAFFFLVQAAFAADGNRLTYLDEFCDPYYPHANFPKLTTPQWVGEEGVDAVVVLAIDDMRDTKKYEAYLRPILERLKKIDGRAPVSIMTCTADPKDPQLAKWIQEGLSIEVHTIDHPCPLLQGGDFDKAKSTYDRCVDLMNEIPGNKPVAFRMPCCDSRNTPSPRFWLEIFNKRTEKGHFLQIDSSVFNVFTSADKELPRELVLEKDGSERFKKYIPFPSFVNTIENYPYPYVIGRLCWQFPCMVPSDWEAQNLHRPNNPKTVEDMKAALDATVIKQGVFNMVFHPHGWIRNDQIVDLIDYAQEKYGKRVKFLTFREAIDRLNKHMLDGQALRDETGSDNAVRILDVNNDGFMDVVIGHHKKRVTRVWHPRDSTWKETSFPVALVPEESWDNPHTKNQFGVMRLDGAASFVSFVRDTADLFDDEKKTSGEDRFVWYHFDGTHWIEDKEMQTTFAVVSMNHLLRDLDNDGVCEVVNQASRYGHMAWKWNNNRKRWDSLAFALPKGIDISSRITRPWATSEDNGFRFVDVNSDGKDDVFLSNNEQYSLYLFDSMMTGWSRRVVHSPRGEGNAFPALARIQRERRHRAGPFTGIDRIENNGGWFHSGHLWVQNEHTNRLPDFVDRLSFADMLKPLAKREATLKLPPVPIGAAKIDITPDYPVRLSGYGSRKMESEGVAQKLWTKALAIGDDEGDGAAILITVENCGMTPAIRNKVAKSLEEKAKIRNDRLAISVSHSHTAPCLTNWAPYIFGSDVPPDQQARIDRYTNELTGKLVQVALDALKQRRPGRLFWGQTQVDFASNRRVIKDGRWSGFGVQADGPVDHSLPVLVAKDEDGKLISIVANYACHCTTLGGDFNKIAGDWAGFAQDMIEKDHPGAVAFITIGCGADANPNPRGKFEQSEDHGKSLAAAVQRLLKDDFLEPIDSRPRCRLTDIDLPLAKLPTREQWQQRTKESGATGYHARQMLKKLDAGEKLQASVNYPIATWTFGEDLAMVFLGGEVVVDYAIRLKEELDADRLWITAYANDVPCYIPSRRILREGGYEADHSMIYYARPTRFDPAVEDLIVDTVQKLVPAEFYSEKKQVDFPAPKSTDEALKSFKLRPGIKIELVAAEPLIVDPVAFDWSPDGRLWVVEMSDYPNGIGWQREGDLLGKPGGRIKFLTDEDGDGRYDKSTVFLDEIPFPTGVKVWRKGILVTAAPDIFYAEDTDGDGKADKRQVLYQGFGEGNQQHRVNGLRWGLDNWLHVGNGDSDGKIKSLKTGKVVDVSGRDLRIRPDEGLIETTSGRTQFGRSRDDWGNWFGGNNSNPMWHYVLDDRYLRRNPHFAPPSVRKDVPEQPGAAPVFPASRTLARFNDLSRANRFTSACSPIIYRDELIPSRMGSQPVQGQPDGRIENPSYSQSFVCEPVHNLVHREIVTLDGMTFTSRRADDEQESEFLASTDNWFRPVMVRTGPDGALWIADMYRFVIEHPKWIPKDWQRRLDLRAGDNRGRIYRVYPADSNPREVPRLDKLSTEQLVETLKHPNGWVRDTVQQMLIWKNDKAAMKPLEEIVVSSEQPLARLHAMCTLAGMSALRPEMIAHGVGQRRHPGVQRHAVRLSEPFLEQKVDDSKAPWSQYGNNPFLRDGEVKTVGDFVWESYPIAQPPHQFDGLLAMQLAYTLGESKSGLAGTDLRWVSFKRFSNPYLSAAIASSINSNNVGQLLEAALSRPKVPYELVEQLLVTLMAIGDDELRAQALSSLVESNGSWYDFWQLTAMDAVLDMLDRRMRMQLLNKKEVRTTMEEFFQYARAIAEDEDESDQRRTAATRLLARRSTKRDEDLRLLGRLLAPSNPLSVQSAALESLGRQTDTEVAETILAPWKSYSPSLRTQSLDVLMSRAPWTSSLINAIETKQLSASHIDARRRQQLLVHKNDALRTRAERVFSAASSMNRQKVVDQYGSALALPADVGRGKLVFKQRCSACHRLEDVGHVVGPDLAALSDKSPHSLLVGMFDPNRAVEDKFLDYHIITHEGKQLTGLITEETGSSIKLLAADGKQQTVLRNQIEEMRATGKSLMPEGLEKDLTKQDTADLIAYLRGSGPPPKQFPGNKPELVTADNTGTLNLTASAARIYGPRIVFEQKYRNLGWWAREQDYAAWSIVIPKPHRYRVILDYASHPDAAGDRFQLSIAGQQLKGTVTSTGTWDNYLEKQIGTLDLPAGAAELVFRSDGRVRSALIDLRTVRLEPLNE